jgi:hypothetical protein
LGAGVGAGVVNECSSFRNGGLLSNPRQFDEAPDYEKQENNGKKRNLRPFGSLSSASRDVQQERYKTNHPKAD